MQASDIMTRTVVTVTATATIQDAATVLASNGFTALPVVDDDGVLIGLLTEADILRDRFPHDPRFYCSDEGSIQRPDTRAPAATVGGVMTVPAASVRPGADVVDVLALMRADGLRTMPVVDGARLVGIVTRRDLVRTLTRDDQAVATDVRHQLGELRRAEPLRRHRRGRRGDHHRRDGRPDRPARRDRARRGGQRCDDRPHDPRIHMTAQGAPR